MTYVPTKKELRLALQVHDMEKGDIEEAIYWFAVEYKLYKMKASSKFTPESNAPTGMAISGLEILKRIYRKV